MISTTLIVQAIIDAILIAGVYAMLSLGVSLSYGVMKVCNWAHGELLMVGMYICFLLVSFANIDPYLCILIVGPIMFLVGFFLQKSVLNGMLERNKEPEPIVIFLFTAGLGMVLKNVASTIFSSNPSAIKTNYTSVSLQLGEYYISLPKLISFIIAIGCIGIVFYIVQKTEFGRAIRATSQNRNVSQLMGINYKNLFCVSQGLCVALVGISACLLLPFQSVSPSLGSTYNMLCFIIIILGGRGSIMGAAVGALIIGLVQKIGGAVWSSANADIIVYVLFIVILIVKPTGLFGKESS